MEKKEAKAYLRYVRIAPRKVQIVCDLIRGKDAGTAMAVLMQTPKDKLVVVQDLEGYLVAEQGNALLICKKDDQNAIRKFDSSMTFRSANTGCKYPPLRYWGVGFDIDF